MTESDVYEAIAKVHAPPEWACFRDVANATGWNGKRRADAIAMNLYPSRGMEIRGFEIKVSRSDLRRELDAPDKAEEIGKFCNTWWIVVPDGLADKDLIPLAWGIMEVGEKGLRTKRAAVARPAEEVCALSRPFVGAVARAAQKDVERMRKDWIPRSEVAGAMEDRYRAGIEAAPRESKFRIEALERRLSGARPILAALGIDADADDFKDRLDGATGEKAAEALAIGRALQGKYHEGAEFAAKMIQTTIAKLTEARDGLVSLLPPGQVTP
jgi:hypothetical protein